MHFREEKDMTTVQIILVCVFCVLAMAGGVLAWWFDNGGTFKKDTIEDKNDNNINKSESNNKGDINEKN